MNGNNRGGKGKSKRFAALGGVVVVVIGIGAFVGARGTGGAELSATDAVPAPAISIPAGVPSAATTPAPPTEADFEWYLQGRAQGVPGGAQQIEDLSQVMGQWKLLLWFDPDHEVNEESGYFLGYLDIYSDNGELRMRVQPFLMVSDDGTREDIGDALGDTYLAYQSSGGGLYGGNAGMRYHLDTFYGSGADQYGVGRLVLENGEPCHVALVRP